MRRGIAVAVDERERVEGCRHEQPDAVSIALHRDFFGCDVDQLNAVRVAAGVAYRVLRDLATENIRIRPAAAIDDVHAVTGLKRVGARSSTQRVVPHPAIERVAGSAGTRNGDVGVKFLQHLGQRIRAVVERERFDRPLQPIPDGNRIAAAVENTQKTRRLRVNQNLDAGEVGINDYRIEATGVGNRILPIAQRELKHVVARAAAQKVVARAADQRVVAAVGKELVVARLPRQPIVAFLSRRDVARIVAGHHVVAVTAGQYVVAGLTEHHVVAAPAVEVIVAAAAQQPVVAGTSIKAVRPALSRFGDKRKPAREFEPILVAVALGNHLARHRPVKSKRGGVLVADEIVVAGAAQQKVRASAAE